MKKNDDLLHEDLPSELEARILRNAAPALLRRQHRAAPSPWLRWGGIFGGLGAAAMLAIIFVPRLMSPEKTAPGAMVEAELLENLHLLMVMQELQNDELLQRVKGEGIWQKSKERG